jgi:hypothetical protein
LLSPSAWCLSWELLSRQTSAARIACLILSMSVAHYLRRAAQRT